MKKRLCALIIPLLLVFLAPNMNLNTYEIKALASSPEPSGLAYFDIPENTNIIAHDPDPLFPSPMPSMPPLRKTIVNYVNIYRTPDIFSESLAVLDQGTTVEVIEPDSLGGFDKVKYGDIVGYVLCDWISTLRPAEKNKSKPVRQIDKTKPMIAITFDDGPCFATPRILDTFEKYNSAATFFVNGKCVVRHPEMLKQIENSGCEVANHSWSHYRLPTQQKGIIEYEIRSTTEIINEYLEHKEKLLRPPYGAYNNIVLETARADGLPIVKWNVEPKDWLTKNAQKTYDYILSNAADGSIILCHDQISSTAEVMEYIVPELIFQGYQLVTVSELFECKNIELLPGEVYMSAVLEN